VYGEQVSNTDKQRHRLDEQKIPLARCGGEKSLYCSGSLMSIIYIQFVTRLIPQQQRVLSESADEIRTKYRYLGWHSIALPPTTFSKEP